MQLTESWTQLTTGTGALIQASGTGKVSIVYAATTPTTEDGFSINKTDAQVYPAIAGKNMYAKSNINGAVITVEITD